MRKKVLFCATVDFHFTAFHLPYLKWFKDQGWEVHLAAAGKLDIPFVDKKYDIPIQRSPFKRKNIGAYKVLKTLIDDHRYEIIHCHTPMGGVLTRLAARKARNHETKVIYTAHGFHFCKGAPLLNWLVYYPIEKVLARYTDCLITINEEDFSLAVNHHFKATRIEHVHGVGVNTERFTPVKDKSALRKKYHYPNDTFLMFYAAEFNKNKNQQILIEALPFIKEQLPTAKLLLAGDGPLIDHCKQLAKNLGVEEMVDFLGYRQDVESLLKMSDIAVASSLREGLPVNIMEAMACGLPIVAVDNRGHRELVFNNQNGFLVGKEAIEIANKIINLAVNKDLREQFGLHSRFVIEEKYSVDRILEESRQMYKKVMDQMEEIQWAVQ
ncbi:glycosyltransferase family 4 protein [Lederbergia citrea]|uniref:Glycosyltransferase family 4 protein n=1 Tax=Lederbergia citrea TaxID=2833581 RepID=A0A942UTE8_9BACI|nr:glycosyltransferase family 4 protein [Lederbergia citrea]MBS4205819.1 glycosyltransferase family 4 protein [Lederbergia citrea]MBS4224733.1 glycosyltransferase family 4 protein [Lederbergia citrea]